MAKWLCVLSTGVMITSLAFAWLVIPATIKPSDALGLAIKHLYPSSIATDTNTNFNFVTGLGMEPFDVISTYSIKREMSMCHVFIFDILNTS